MVGAASMLAGVTRMTVSLVVIMFELTGSLSYGMCRDVTPVLPIMVAVILAKWFGDKIESESIYDRLIHLNQYPFLDLHQDFIGKNDRAMHILTPSESLDVIDLSNENTISDILAFLTHSKFKGYPIVSSAHDMILLGYIGRSDILLALRQRSPDIGLETRCIFSNEVGFGYDGMDLTAYTDQTPFTIPPQFPTEMVHEVFRKMGFRICFVTYDGALKGVITKKDLCDLGMG
jgi:chloride channel 3/4/5